MNLSADCQFSSGSECTKSFPTALKQAWPVSPAAAVEVNVVRAVPARSAHAPLQQGAKRLGARMSSALPGAGG